MVATSCASLTRSARYTYRVSLIGLDAPYAVLPTTMTGVPTVSLKNSPGGEATPRRTS
jgi:hypothetical protein